MRFRHWPTDFALLLVLILTILVLVTPFVAAQEKPAAKPDAPALTELQRTKAENFLLKAQNLNLQKQSVEQQLQAAQATLDKDRLALEAEFVAALKCPGGWDWQTMGCKPTAPPAAPPAKK